MKSHRAPRLFYANAAEVVDVAAFASLCTQNSLEPQKIVRSRNGYRVPTSSCP